jgi:hypothetical protein
MGTLQTPLTMSVAAATATKQLEASATSNCSIPCKQLKRPRNLISLLI